MFYTHKLSFDGAICPFHLTHNLRQHHCSWCNNCHSNFTASCSRTFVLIQSSVWRPQWCNNYSGILPSKKSHGFSKVRWYLRPSNVLDGAITRPVVLHCYTLHPPKLQTSWSALNPTLGPPFGVVHPLKGSHMLHGLHGVCSQLAQPTNIPILRPILQR